MKKRFLLITLCVMMLATMFGCSPSEPEKDDTKPYAGKKIGFTMMDSKTAIFAQMIEDIQALADADGIEVMINDANRESTTQLNAIDNFITAECDVIMVQAVDGQAVKDALQRAHDLGIYIVDVFVPIEVYDVKYGNDSVSIGKCVAEMAANYLKENYGTTDPIPVCLLGSTNTTTKKERYDAMKDYLLELLPNVQIVNECVANNTEEGYNGITNVLTANPEIKAVVSGWDTYAIGGYNAANAANRSDVAIFGADGDPTVLSYIAEGGNYIGTAALNSQNFGKDIYDMAIALIDQAPGCYDSQFTKPVAVTAENVAEWVKK